MSGSPKYTTAVLDAERRARLAAARRQREEERRRRQEEARQRRLEAGIRAAAARQDAVLTRLHGLARTAQALPQRAEVTAEATRVTGLARATDEASLTRLGKELRKAERRTDALAAAVAGELTVREHGTAVDLVVTQLDTIRDGQRLDPAGHRTVTALTAQARSLLGDPKAFAEVHGRLSTAAGAHLETVRDRQADLLRLAAVSDELTSRLSVVLSEAESAGVRVQDADIRAEAAALREEKDGAHISRWEQRIAKLREQVEVVTADIDERLDQLERTAMVVEAASAALPAAGLLVVPDSLVEKDGAFTFLARRSDGATVELTVYGGDLRSSRLEYRTDGSDTVVEHSADGQISRCDLTEELLERFHEQLDRLGVHTDGLHWQGKPERPGPPGQAVRGLTVRDNRRRA
jgi:hypothetical protein